MRELPRIVPPRGRIPRIDSIVSSSCDVLEHAAPAVAKADQLIAVLVDSLAHDRADDRVEPGTVASAGEHADPHGAQSYASGAASRRAARVRAAPWSGPPHVSAARRCGAAAAAGGGRRLASSAATCGALADDPDYVRLSRAARRAAAERHLGRRHRAARRGVRAGRRPHGRARPRLDRAAELLGTGDRPAGRAAASGSSPTTCAGMGAASPAVDDDYTLERFGEDVAAVLEAAVGPIGPAAGDRRRSFPGRDVDRRLGRRPRCRGGARDAAALVNTGLGDLVAGQPAVRRAGQLDEPPALEPRRARLRGAACPVLLAAVTGADPLRRLRTGRQRRRGRLLRADADRVPGRRARRLRGGAVRHGPVGRRWPA